MASDPTQISDSLAGESSATTAEIVDRLSRFDGPPEQFLVTLLAVQCRLAAAEAGAILRAEQDGKVELLAIYPQQPTGSTAPVWLAQAAESSKEVLGGGKTVIKALHESDSLYGQPAKRHVILTPIRGASSVRGLAAYLIESGDATVLGHCRERLELSISLLSLYEMRLMLQRRQFDLGRLTMAMETLSAVNEHDRFAGAGMAACNEIASRWHCERVGLGFLKGRYVHLRSLSHTEKFNRKMKLVQDIESAMEECLDQDVEILYPVPAEATYISRSTNELSKHHGPMAIVSVPLRRSGQVVGVLTAERPQDRPFSTDEIEALRLTCDLCTARLANLHASDRWFGARAAAAIRKGLSVLVGPKHTWVKMLVIGLFAFGLYAFIGQGDYNADASFVLEATQQQIVPAPFEGYIEAVYVEPGDKVIAGKTVLAKLETIQLVSDLVKARAEYAAAEIEVSVAMAAATPMADGKIAEAQIARAKAAKTKAHIELLERKIAEAEIKSPISGTVVSPDISRRIRGHVDIGDTMFEVAPVELLRAELSVGEDQIADVLTAQATARQAGETLRGKLAAEGKPAKRIEFEVMRINPVAEVEEKKNVFKVRVRLLEQPGWMAPGMKGVAKIHIGRRRHAYLWTRKLVNWVRMKLWL